jgi:protein-arginine kinase activator protein McsA
MEESAVKKVSGYVCEICAKVIPSTYNFKKHMSSHFRLSTVTCNYCGRWICSSQHWTKHGQNCVSANKKNSVNPKYESGFGVTNYEYANTNK